jgi:ribosome-associated heat shock protein Hsp15
LKIEQDHQRLDKWLWCARFFKSRALATKLVSAGRVRLSGKVIVKSSQLIRKGDVLTFPQGGFIRVVKVLFLAARRGPSPEAQLLFEDLSPIEKQQAENRELSEFQGSISNRERGGGRPTKDRRRAIDRLMRRD